MVIRITLKTNQTASNQVKVPCPACDKQCKRCRANGFVIKNETIKVKVPAGVDNGTVIRLRGYGGPGSGGGPDGDF